MRWRGEAVKILEVGSLALFGALSAYTWLAAPEWTVATVRLAVDAGLLAHRPRLACHRPALHAAVRARAVPEAFWAMPLFLTTNRIISAVWAGAFAAAGGRGRGCRVAAGGAALGGRRGVGRGLRGRGLVLALVSRGGAAARDGRRRGGVSSARRVVDLVGMPPILPGTISF